MKALVTGGAGFIGSNIANKLLEMGFSVRILDDLSSGYRSNVPEKAEFIEGSVVDGDVTKEAAAGVDYIFHLAASVGNKRAIDNPISDATINVLGTLNVLEAARATGVKKLVYSSSAGIFGELKTIPIKEDHPRDPDSPYGVSKLAAEKDCLAYMKLYGIPVVCLRYFNVFGVHQRFDAYGNVIPIFADRILKGIPITIFGDGEQTRDFVNAKDVAQANIKSALSEATGVFNIGSASRITINHLAELMMKVSEASVEIEYEPERSGDVRDSLADVSQARDAFGFEPSSDIEAGLKDYMSWIGTDPITRGRLGL
ncbi:MAG: NAD-dependent epimerase/dehydratase family protein [Candidatus Sabulitectum sp.]|nr:NAD-dependent epimerase/dehydratase family protein [Candidatus Sabulitectum sp.]